MSTFKIEFRGKTQDDVRHQFLKWHQESAGLVFNVTGHPIEELPVVLRFPRGPSANRTRRPLFDACGIRSQVRCAAATAPHRAGWMTTRRSMQPKTILASTAFEV